MEAGKTRVFFKEEAYALMADDTFLEFWNYLLQTTSIKYSVFQKPDFLIGWFNSKKNQFSPFFVLEHHEDKLTGLMCLAIENENINKTKGNFKIIGAGEYDAEYQGWLTSHEDQLPFLENALNQVFGYFPNAILSLRFFLDEDIVKAIKTKKNLKKWTTIQEFKRPIAELQVPHFDKILTKRHLKAKINRFNRAGKVELEIIQTNDRLLEVLPQIMALYDFRQGALFNKYPSSKFLGESPLFLELLYSGIIQISILKLDNEITSCIVCYHCNKWVHLAGMITYSPFYAKLSPGLVHIYLLGEKFRSEGFEYFDLTPGYDMYKDKFATTTDMVYELTFCKNKIFTYSKRKKVAFHHFLVNRGIRPMSFDLEIKRKKYLLSNKIKRFFKSLWEKKLVEMPSPAFKEIEKGKNSIKDLLLFKEEGMLTKWKFLENAFKMIENGGEFTTYTYKKKLVACIWFLPSQTQPGLHEEDNLESNFNLKLDLNCSYFSKTISFLKEVLIKEVSY